MGSIVNNFLNCNDCGSVQTLGSIQADQSCILFERPFSQVNRLILLPDGVTPPPDWTDNDSWATVINNADSTDNFGKALSGIGGVPVPEKDVEQYGRAREHVGARLYTLNFRVLNMTEAMYNLLLKLQCGNVRFRFWYSTVSDFFFGGEDGLCPWFLDADIPLGPGNTDYINGDITIKWWANADPSRAAFTFVYPPPYAPPLNVIGDDTTNEVIGEDADNTVIGNTQ